VAGQIPIRRDRVNTSAPGGELAVSVVSRLVSRGLGLPPAQTHHIAVERHLAVPMRDGQRLLADRYHPDDNDQVPVMLMPTPERHRRVHRLVARLIAERGYQVLVCSSRAAVTGCPDRTMDTAAADAEAIMDWACRQSWFHGTAGPLDTNTLGLP
jgi:uncharacterized protein